MAQGRMIQRKISSNKQLPRLLRLLDERYGAPHGAQAVILYTFCIAHLDVEGRMHGDPALVKGNVVPRFAMSAEDVERYLLAMAEVGLVVYYEAEDDRWLYFPGFDSSQPNLRKDREAPSKAPPPDRGSLISAGASPAELGSDAGNGPAEEKRREDQEKRREANSARGRAPARNGQVEQPETAPSQPAEPAEPAEPEWKAEGKPDSPRLGRMVDRWAKDLRPIFEELVSARKRSIDGAHELRPTYGNLVHIAARLEAGARADECLHVIAVAESEVKSGGEPHWFNPVTLFRPDNFARKLAAPIGLRTAREGPTTLRGKAIGVAPVEEPTKSQTGMKL